MAKHTLGPWRWEDGILVGANEEGVIDRDDNVIQGDIYERDARLIAKAPEMYELLRELVDMYDPNDLTPRVRSLLKEINDD
jgi:hypothetical protein